MHIHRRPFQAPSKKLHCEGSRTSRGIWTEPRRYPVFESAEYRSRRDRGESESEIREPARARELRRNPRVSLRVDRWRFGKKMDAARDGKLDRCWGRLNCRLA